MGDTGNVPIGGAAPGLTYREIGATTWSQLPPGYHHQQRVQRIGFGQDQFVAAAQRLAGWDMHRRAGVRIDVDFPVFLDQLAVLRLQLGPLEIAAPVRVVYLVDEPRERGFAYGTLDSHPEIGEERFTVRIDGDDVVWAEIRAFSRPGRWFTRLGGPLARRVQAVMTQRYLVSCAVNSWHKL